MPGGPSQTDTFDLKPGHKNGGPFKEIATSVPGMRISEHLPKLAQRMEHLAIIRSMSTKEGDHTRATYFLRTGYLPNGPIQYPALGPRWARKWAATGPSCRTSSALARSPGSVRRPIRPASSARAMLRWSSARRVKRN